MRKKILAFGIVFLGVPTFGCSSNLSGSSNQFYNYAETVSVSNVRIEKSCKNVEVTLKPYIKNGGYELYLSSAVVSIIGKNRKIKVGTISPSIVELPNGSKKVSFCIVKSNLSSSELLLKFNYKDKVIEHVDGTVEASSLGCIIQESFNLGKILNHS
jgi:hypothetical protein